MYARFSSPNGSSPRRILASLLGIATLVLSHAGCDRSEAPSKDEQSREGQALKLVIPSHKSTPRVELAFRVKPLEKSEMDQVKEPIGNAIYLALRECDEAHPSEGAATVVPVTFEVQSGTVANVSKREPKVSGDAEPVGESGRKCVLEQLSDSEVEFSGGDFGDRDLQVEAQAKLTRKSP